MKRLLLILLCVGLFLPSVVAWAQAPANTVTEVHFMKPKAGMQTHFEEGRKRHMSWHKAQNDKWSWITWEILTGPETGSYVTISPGHSWKDFDGRDEFQRMDGADASRAVAGAVEENRMSYWIMRNDLSRNPMTNPPARFITVTRYWVDPASVTLFTDTIKKINAAIDKTKYPTKPSRWAQLANGGEGPQFVMHTDRASMSDLEPPEKTIDAAIAEAYGKAEGAAMMDAFRKAIRRMTTEMREYRGDLSYNPGN